MTNGNVDYDEITREMQEFSQRVARGVSALASVGDVSIGGAPKDVVFTLDKLTLYRYRPVEKVAES